MRLLPIGTHTWSKFLRPSELCNILEENGIEVSQLTGMRNEPYNLEMASDSKDLTVNYPSGLGRELKFPIMLQTW